MLLSHSIALYIIITIVVFLVFYYGLQINLFSSITISMIIGLIALMFIYPPRYLMDEKNLSLISTYILILFVTPFVVIIYSLFKGISDRR